MFFQYRKLFRNEKIVVGVDTSMGLNDYCVAMFLSRTELDVPLVYRERCIASEMTNKLFPVLESIYDKTGNKPLIAYERNNGGVFELERLAHLNRNNKYTIFEMKKIGNVDNPEPTRLGWDTNTATRSAMLIALKEAIDNKLFRVYDKTTIEEMFSFVKVQTSTVVKAQAESNCFDDCVMALAIAWQLYLDVQSEISDGAVDEAMARYKQSLAKIESGGAGY